MRCPASYSPPERLQTRNPGPFPGLPCLATAWSPLALGLIQAKCPKGVPRKIQAQHIGRMHALKPISRVPLNTDILGSPDSYLSPSKFT